MNVTACTAKPTVKRIPLHKIHAGCCSRIEQKPICPIHGALAKEKVVAGYKSFEGTYIIADRAESYSDDDKAITIKTFIDPKALDPMYQTGRSYYLPSSRPSRKRDWRALSPKMGEVTTGRASKVRHG
jgi:non-homologous end joining protein Ku